MVDDFVYDAGALRTLFDSTTGPVAKEVERRAIRVEAAAKRLCPVDTGRLRASITHELGKDGEGIVGRVGTNVDYGIHVELGNGNSPEQPYLRPALGAAR